MRILYFETWIGAFSTHRSHLLQAAQAAGHDVHLVAPEADTEGRLSAAGFTYHQLHMDRSGVNPLNEARVVYELARLFARVRPDLVHLIALKSVLYGSLAARLTGLRAVVGSITGLGYTFIPGGVKRRGLAALVLTSLRAALAGRGPRIIVQNPDDFAFFVGNGVVPESRCSIIFGSGVDVERFVPSPEPQGVPKVLVGTRMLWDKGIGELADAVRQLRARGVAGEVILSGAPDPANPASIPVAQLRAWVDEGLVQWRGHSSDMPGLLRESSLACLPSYREGLPLFLAEAAAAGRPVVTTDVPGCRSVINNEETGLLVKVRDATSLARGLERLLTDAPLRARMGRAARALALERFSKEAVTRAIFDVYRSALDNR
jgi:glycosyltransferase involved in cell wall biosynthesis